MHSEDTMRKEEGNWNKKKQENIKNNKTEGTQRNACNMNQSERN